MKNFFALLTIFLSLHAVADGKTGYQSVMSEDKDGVETEYFTGFVPTPDRFKGVQFRAFDAKTGGHAFETLPKELDLRPFSQRVRKQACGDCWAQGGMTMFEALVQYRDKVSIYGSVQQVIDCSNFGGCGGGQISIKDYEKGVIYESDYKYKGFNQQCKNSGIERHQKSESTFYVDDVSRDSLQHAMLEMGPLEVCGAASALKNGGWINAGGGSTNHCYAAMGWLYGPDHGHPECETWLIFRNSWGADWGADGGYVYVCYAKPTTKTQVVTEAAGSVYKSACTPQPSADAGPDKNIILKGN